MREPNRGICNLFERFTIWLRDILIPWLAVDSSAPHIRVIPVQFTPEIKREKLADLFPRSS
jgi:hypothetical protein